MFSEDVKHPNKMQEETEKRRHNIQEKWPKSGKREMVVSR